jgi:hypothetical protein
MSKRIYWVGGSKGVGLLVHAERLGRTSSGV